MEFSAFIRFVRENIGCCFCALDTKVEFGCSNNKLNFFSLLPTYYILHCRVMDLRVSYINSNNISWNNCKCDEILNWFLEKF